MEAQRSLAGVRPTTVRGKSRCNLQGAPSGVGGWNTAAPWRQKRQPLRTLRNADFCWLRSWRQVRSWVGRQVTYSLDKDKIHVLDIQDCWLEKAPKAEA